MPYDTAARFGFPYWEQSIPLLGTKHSLTGNKAFPYWEQSIPLLGIILLISPPFGRGDAQQVAHEEVHALMVAEGLAHGVVGTGDDDQLEVLAGTL